MGKSVHDLPKDRLATTDASGRRVHLYPREVSGRFKRAKNLVHGVLLFVLLVLPWIQIAGQQAVLLDIPRRRFAFFGVTFWAHDVPMLFLVAAVLVACIMLVSVIWGRAWCGWACPQTVFVETLFRRIETIAEGNSVERRLRDQGPWTLAKVSRRLLKWGLYLAVTLVITHSLLAYFVGTDRIGEMITSPPAANPVAFGVMVSFSALLLFDFGWFREQFCIIMCPYGRLQSMLLDGHSYTVAYDNARGEPRRAGPQAVEAEPRGDCVNCYRCVAVCPTGIDIRRGSGQLECIACTACMDACDDVMSRLKKPKGLIRYDTERGLAGKSPRARHARPRVLVIAGMLLVFVGVLSGVLVSRQEMVFEILRPKGMPYQVAGSGEANGTDTIINRFELESANQAFDSMEVSMGLSKADLERGVVLIAPESHAEVEGGKRRQLGFFVRFPRSLLSAGVGRAVLEIEYARAVLPESAKTRRKELHLAGPAR